MAFLPSVKGGVSEIRDGSTLSTGWTFHANLVLLGSLIKDRENRGLKINMLFVDEPFATIPMESVERVSEVLGLLGKDKSMNIITHSQVLDLTLARIIRIGGGIDTSGKEVPSFINQ